MTAHRDEIIQYINDALNLHEHPDYGPMGLQVTGCEEVKRVACLVSVSNDLIRAAGELGSQMILAHHGLFWNNESRELDRRVGGRIALLKEYGMSLAGYHLALDAHPTFGNNVMAATRLGLKNLKPFEGVGWGGTYDLPLNLQALRRMAYNAFQKVPLVYPYGPELIQKVAVIVGGAPQYVIEAKKQGYDAFITGEAAEPTVYTARDLGIHFLACGHHATEKDGVKHLGKMLKIKFGVNDFFVDANNSI